MKKFGIDSTLKESEEIAEATKSILSIPTEKLAKMSENSLANISGGISKPQRVGMAKAVAGVTGVALSIASIVCAVKGDAKTSGAFAVGANGLGLTAVLLTD